MMQNPINNTDITVVSPKPRLRTLITQSASKKWQGCVYFSPYDATGQALMLLKTANTSYDGMFLKNPIYIYTSTDKSVVETQMDNKIKCLIRSNTNNV